MMTAHKDLNKEVAQRLRLFGKHRFFSMKGLATALGMSPSALNASYLSGRSIPGGSLLVKLHQLGCDPTWLLTGEGLAPIPTEEELFRYLWRSMPHLVNCIEPKSSELAHILFSWRAGLPPDQPKS